MKLSWPVLAYYTVHIICTSALSASDVEYVNEKQVSLFSQYKNIERLQQSVDVRNDLTEYAYIWLFPCFAYAVSAIPESWTRWTNEVSLNKVEIIT